MGMLDYTKKYTKADLGPVDRRKTSFVDALNKEVKKDPTAALRTVYVLNVVHIFLFLFIPVGYVWQTIAIGTPNEYTWDQLFRWIFKQIFFLSGIKFEVEGWNEIPQGKPFVFCPNHASYLDGVIMDVIATGHKSRCVVAPIPYFPYPFNFWLKKIGSIDVVRDQEEKEKFPETPRPKEVLERAVKRIHQGEIILVFPEGHMEREKQLMYFHTGPIRIALKAKCDLIPVSIIGSSDVLPAKKFILKKGKIKVIFHKPISLEKYYGMYEDKTLVKRLTWELEKDAIESLPKSFIPEPILEKLPKNIKEKRGWE